MALLPFLPFPRGEGLHFLDSLGTLESIAFSIVFRCFRFAFSLAPHLANSSWTDLGRQSSQLRENDYVLTWKTYFDVNSLYYILSYI